MDPDCKIIGVGDGVHGLQTWRDLRSEGTTAQLMLVDNHMGEVDGFETISYIRKEGYEGPAFILTGDQNIKNRSPNEVTDVLYKPLKRQHIYKAYQSIGKPSEPDESFPSTDQLSSLLEDLNESISGGEDALSEMKFKVSCTVNPIESSNIKTPAHIVNLDRKCVCLLSTKAMYRNERITIKAPPPLNLDIDALISRHRSTKDGFVYCCEFLSIRRALV